MNDSAETDLHYEHRMRVWEAKRMAHSSLFAAHLGVIGSFASLGINAIILGNSASAGAVLAFLGSVWEKPAAKAAAGPALDSVATFAMGVAAGIICALASYFAQACYSHWDLGNNHDNGKRAWLWVGVPFHVLAVAAALAGLVLFVVGARSGLGALAAAAAGI